MPPRTPSPKQEPIDAHPDLHRGTAVVRPVDGYRTTPRCTRQTMRAMKPACRVIYQTLMRTYRAVIEISYWFGPKKEATVQQSPITLDRTSKKPVARWSRRRILPRVGVILAAVIVVVVSFSSPASANSVSLGATGASGTATWHASSRTNVGELRMSVRDTKCNGHSAEIGIVFYSAYTAGQVYNYTVKHVNSKGCNTSQSWYDGTFQLPVPWPWINCRVYVWGGEGNVVWSMYHDNPYT
jgi:hypothetical protein